MNPVVVLGGNSTKGSFKNVLNLFADKLMLFLQCFLWQTFSLV